MCTLTRRSRSSRRAILLRARNSRAILAIFGAILRRTTVLEQAILKSIVASHKHTLKREEDKRRKKERMEKRLESLVAADRLHITARGPHPKYPHRFDVPDELVPWAKEWDEYAPDEYTHPSLVENDRSKKEGGWADPPDPKAIGRGDCVDAKTGKRVPGWDDPSRASELLRVKDEFGLPPRM